MNTSPSMMTVEEVKDYLETLEDALPPGILRELNGGIILVHEAMPSPDSLRGDLFVLGMYHYEPQGLGRYITIYYGSLATVYGHQGIEKQKDVLREVLHHELTHHLESLAGARDLEHEDEAFLRKYRSGEPTDRH